MESVAVPPESATAGWAVPSIVNCTVPVTVLGDTVAVKVTGWPDVDGLAEEDIDVDVVVIVIWLTVCVIWPEVLAALFVSPEYAAVII